MYSLSEYQEAWSVQFERIAAYLRVNLEASCIIHHVGSTSIPAMPAKAIIDISVEYSHGLKPKLLQMLERAGYLHLGDLGLSGRDAFNANSRYTLYSLPQHHLYACESGAYELKKHLAFRDYLRANPDRALWLASKKRLAANESSSKSEYIENKSRYYEIITTESLASA